MLELAIRLRNLFLIITLISSSVIFPNTAVAEKAIHQVSFQKGMCFATWSKDRYASKYSAKSLGMLKEMGVEYVQIIVTQYQEKFNSTNIIRTSLTPSDKSIISAIKNAHKVGLKVMLKPHLDLINKEGGSYWRADIGFYNDPDWEKWFKNYDKFITHYARISEKYDVEIFCLGTELSFTTQKTEKWRDIIAKVRKRYSGTLTYAANWDNYRNIKFWDMLDFAGIDAYFPLSYDSNPSLADIKKGWDKWIREIESFQAEIKRPIVFTEIGYSSASHAASEPWKNGTGNANVEIQAKCYSAFFEEVWSKSWLAGVYWWKWAPSVYGGGKYNRRFTPMNKPAAEILEEHYTSPREEKIAMEADINALEETIKKTQPAMEDIYIYEIESPIPEKLRIEPLSYGTLLPSFKTKYRPEFKEEWKNKVSDAVRREEGE